MGTLPRDERVRSRADFVRVQRAPAVRVRARSFLLLATARATPGPTRLGIVASKKVGNAVLRNRSKRLVRELFRQEKPTIAGVDLVVVVSEVLPTRTLIELRHEWSRAIAELERRGLARRR